MQSADHALWADIEVRPFAAPVGLDPGHPVRGRAVLCGRHVCFHGSYITFHGSKCALGGADGSGAGGLGANYFVTHEFLPADHPLYGAALRALPAGLVLLALSRQRPHGAWWGRSAVLGLLNVGVFFFLVFTASQLPTSVASTVMAVSP